MLGLASEQERAEFEQLCVQYPELVEARTSFELAVEKQAMQYAEEPIAGNKERIWRTLDEPPSESAAKPTAMEPKIGLRTFALAWLATAASVIFMLITAYAAYHYYKKTKALTKTNNEYAEIIEQLNGTISAKAEEDRVMHDPNVMVVNLDAMKQNAPSAAICWDTLSTNVYLLIKNMPKLATSRQYQLWSLIDSAGKKKATSLGMFDGGKERLFIRMSNAQKADAFAITIEKSGNTGGPDPTQMQLMGETEKSSRFQVPSSK